MRYLKDDENVYLINARGYNSHKAQYTSSDKDKTKSDMMSIKIKYLKRINYKLFQKSANNIHFHS